MNAHNNLLKKIPCLDPAFRPAIIENREFLKAVEDFGQSCALIVAVERENNQVAVVETKCFPSGIDPKKDQANFKYAERLIKTLLWVKGGWKIMISGNAKLAEEISCAYSPNGLRAFDAAFMSRVYEKEFAVEVCEPDKIPHAKESSVSAGGNLNGCRIGFDAGGSDRKVAAVKDGEVVYSEEVIWHPKLQSDPHYHYSEILAALKTAAAHLPRVDAVGVSSAGIFVNNRTMVASLFNNVPQEQFDAHIKDIYIAAARELGDVPVQVRNDGDVTALAGAMTLNDTNILGIAMGTSEAAGYIDGSGGITGWLNELCFVPVDFNPDSMVDEWSGDYGCGVKYFSQDAVIKLAPAAGITLPESLSPAEKLKAVQELAEKGLDGARKIFETIGIYLGYSLAYYAEFYDIKHILILGRVTSGVGGNLILREAQEVLPLEFPELAEKVKLHLPDESSRRVGQAIAAASLPVIT